VLEWIAWLGGLGLVLLILYWLLIVTEGVYLGRRVVVWLYDVTAGRYDGIKGFDEEDERFGVARPLLAAVAGVRHPLVLDVATGTGRLPWALLREEVFRGRIIGVDASGPMLAKAVGKLRPLGNGAELVQGVAGRLPFGDEVFEAVTCLEALEFFPSDEAALGEMVRVLRPGGFLMVSRRTGWQGKLFLGRYRPKENFEGLLASLGIEGVETRLWEVDYDMVIGRKELRGTQANSRGRISSS
jgi:SAM-dependent methyltransferase